MTWLWFAGGKEAINLSKMDYIHLSSPKKNGRQKYEVDAVCYDGTDHPISFMIQGFVDRDEAKAFMNELQASMSSDETVINVDEILDLEDEDELLTITPAAKIFGRSSTWLSGKMRDSKISPDPVKEEPGIGRQWWKSELIEWGIKTKLLHRRP